MDAPSSPHQPVETTANGGPDAVCSTTKHRRQRIECGGIVLDHDLPDQLPILPAEIDLLSRYFADLIEQALKAPT
jgi:hypothetical protein